MKPNIRKIIISVFIAFTSVALSLLIAQIQLIQRWENQAHDVLFRDFQKKNFIDEAVIIAIDQNSLDYFQNQFKILWPWPRDIYAAATEYLGYCEAKTITFDVIFSSPDIDRLNVEAEYADSLFAFQMKKNERVILASQMEDSTHFNIAPALDTFSVQFEYDIPSEIIKTYPRATLPIYKFQKSMAHPGAVNFFTDSDGICRKVPLIFKYNGKIYPYMALTAAFIYDDVKTVQFDNKSRCLISGNHCIPLNKDGFFNIYWYGPSGPGNTFKYTSFVQLLQSYIQWKSGEKPLIPSETFKNKAVFIGATAAGLLDLKTTPFSSIEPYPGVEIYATVFSNIIRDDFISRFPITLWIVISILLLFILSFIWQKIKIWLSAVISLVFFFLPLLTAVILFQNYKMFAPIVSSEIAILLSVIIVLVTNFFTEGREKRQVKKVFNRYLHPAVVETLTQNPEKLEMGGKEIEATVLFTDIQGFTGISEHFSPPEIVEFLNDYFEKVEQIIFNNNGMLDKYTGDGIMAIFGAPIENREHALFTCKAALEFNKLSSLKIETKNRSIPLITRIGINSGRFVVGNIGSSHRMDYTAIGDTVNLSARLEGVNKIYGTQNIISETTYGLVKDKFICRELDFIRVKGRDKPLRIYSVISKKEDLDNNTEKYLSMHKEVLELYRKRKFKLAAIAFEKLTKIRPDDPVAEVFHKRCQQLIINPELIDDKGVFNITIK